MKRTAAIIALAGSLALPAGAAATVPSAWTQKQAVVAADVYWAARGLSACPSPRLSFRAIDSLAWAYLGPGLTPGYCVITYSPEWPWRGRAGALDFCAVTIHERGHQAGLKHRPGIMARLWDGRIPRVCRWLMPRSRIGR